MWFVDISLFVFLIENLNGVTSYKYQMCIGWWFGIVWYNKESLLDICGYEYEFH